MKQGNDAGQFFWGTKQAIRNDAAILSGVVIPYVLSRHLVQDIDTFDDWDIAEILYKNIKKLKCEKKTRVFNEDVFNFFENEELKNEKLDLIFLDPPYKEENIKIILEKIANLKLLKESGLIVLHRHKKAKDAIGNKFTIKRSVKYGISKIIFVKIN